MSMTIQVYTVNPDTGERTVKVRTYTVLESESPDLRGAWPPCNCPMPACHLRRHAMQEAGVANSDAAPPPPAVKGR